MTSNSHGALVPVPTVCFWCGATCGTALMPVPTVCFWCGATCGTALMPDPHGPTPKRMIASYAPCEACEARWATGTVFIEVAAAPAVAHQFPIDTKANGEGLYPTGRMIVLKTEDVAVVLPEPLASEIVAKHVSYIEPEALDMILLVAHVEEVIHREPL